MGAHTPTTAAFARARRVARVQAWFDWATLLAAIATVPTYVAEVRDPNLLTATLNWAIWLTFLLELVVMSTISPSARAWLREHPLEIAVVAFTPPLLPAALQVLRVLRVLRIVIVVRQLRNLFTLSGLYHSAALTAAVIIAGGAAFVDVETDQHLSLVDGMWWSIVTATTTGYGDIRAETVLGRLIGAVVMVMGVLFVALLTASFAQRFLQRDEAEELSDLAALKLQLDRIERQLAHVAQVAEARADGVDGPER